jgi:hypothetical protein
MNGGTYSNWFGPGPAWGVDRPMTMADLYAARRLLSTPRPKLPDFTVPLSAIATLPLRIDRARRRAWIAGIPVLSAPVEPGVWYHVAPLPRHLDPLGTSRETIITADPLRMMRRLRRSLARAGHRGRRGAVRVQIEGA